MSVATQPLSIWKRTNYYSQAPQTRCKSFLARNTLFSPHTWIFIIKPILFRTSGNQRPTSHRCHHSANKSSGAVTSIFLFIFFKYLLLNTMLELYYICNLESCLFAQHRRPRSSKASVFNGCSAPFWGMVTCGATLWLVIIWSVSSVLLLFTEERCTRLRAGCGERQPHFVLFYRQHWICIQGST